MGKERAEPSFCKRSPKDASMLGAATFRLEELTKLWKADDYPIRKPDVTEDGYALVTIRSSQNDSVVLCTGLKNEGNDFKHLTNLLKTKKVIPKSRKVEGCFLYEGLVWNTMDPLVDRFRSGDRVLILMEESAKREKKPKCAKKQGEMLKKVIAKKRLK